MVRSKYKPVSPDAALRELRKDFKRLRTKEEPGPERAALLATFCRAAHDLRQLNMVMHAAQLCVEEDPDQPQMLVEAYLTADIDEEEERLRVLVDLQDLGRWIDHDEIETMATEQLESGARAWVAEVEDAERRHRLRSVASMVSQEYADRIRDELEFL